MSLIPNYVPSGYKVLNVMLTIKNASAALDWYNRAFGAEEVMRLTDPNTGKIVHAELKIADTRFMVVDAMAEGFGSSVILQLYTGDVEGFVENAVKEGAEILLPIKNHFHGDRSCLLKDPFGHQWIVATHVEDVSPNEMQKRFNKLFQ